MPSQFILAGEWAKRRHIMASVTQCLDDVSTPSSTVRHNQFISASLFSTLFSQWRAFMVRRGGISDEWTPHGRIISGRKRPNEVIFALCLNNEAIRRIACLSQRQQSVAQ